MKTNVQIPQAIRDRVEYKRKFTLREMYRAFVFLPGAVRRMVDNKNQPSVDEAKAIMFAQHFADASGFPEKFAFASIVKEYGERQADIMLSAVQIMIAGNMYGIPFSALQSRLKGKPFK